MLASDRVFSFSVLNLAILVGVLRLLLAEVTPLKECCGDLCQPGVPAHWSRKAERIGLRIKEKKC